MIQRAQERQNEITENMRGGPGRVLKSALASPEQLNNKGRMFSIITLEPGCGIGFHTHEGETELFYLMEGEADYSDNGVLQHVQAGDVTICPPGEGHSITNNSQLPTKLVALILYA